jgi:hypothetical protein
MPNKGGIKMKKTNMKYFDEMNTIEETKNIRVEICMEKLIDNKFEVVKRQIDILHINGTTIEEKWLVLKKTFEELK